MKCDEDNDTKISEDSRTRKLYSGHVIYLKGIICKKVII